LGTGIGGGERQEARGGGDASTTQIVEEMEGMEKWSFFPMDTFFAAAQMTAKKA
jgi:hypothetical protein